MRTNPKLFGSLTRHERVFLRNMLAILMLSVVILLYHQFLTHSDTYPAVGGSYSEGIVGVIDNISPIHFHTEADREIAQLVYAGLARYDLTEHRMVPDLAKSWEISEDGLTYLVELQSQARWHDQKPLTADDVVFTYSTLLQSPEYTGPHHGTFDNVAITRIDDHTVSFVLEKSDAFFLRNLAIGLLPQHQYANTSLEMLSVGTQRLIGAGPYRVTKLTTDRVHLARFSDFVGEPTYIANVTIYTYPSSEALAKRVRHLDGVRDVNEQTTLAVGHRTNLERHQISFPRYVGTFFNLDQELLSDRNLRLAFRQATNRQNLIDVLGPEYGAVGSPVFINQAWGESEYDPVSAAAILDRTGYTLRPEIHPTVRVNSQGQKLSFIMLTLDDPIYERVAEFLGNELGKLGVDLVIVKESTGLLLEKIQNRTYDILLYGISLGSDLDLYPYWHSSQIGSSGQNLSQYASLAADKLLTDIRQTTDPDKHEELLRSLEQRLLADTPVVPLYTPKSEIALDKKLKNVTLDTLPTFAERFLALRGWYIKEKHKL